MLGSVVLGSLSPFGSGKGEELVTRQATVSSSPVSHPHAGRGPGENPLLITILMAFSFPLLQLFSYGGSFLPLGSMTLRMWTLVVWCRPRGC